MAFAKVVFPAPLAPKKKFTFFKSVTLVTLLQEASGPN